MQKKRLIKKAERLPREEASHSITITIKIILDKKYKSSACIGFFPVGGIGLCRRATRALHRVFTPSSSGESMSLRGDNLHKLCSPLFLWVYSYSLLLGEKQKAINSLLATFLAWFFHL